MMLLPPPGRVPKFLLPLLFVLLGVAPAISQDTTSVKDTFDITNNAIRLPHHFKKWGFQISAGLLMVSPPKDLVETAVQAPLVNIHMTFGLPWRFSLEGDVTSILVSNQFTLGPRWGYGVRNFYFNLGWDLAFIYGQMKQGGFNNSTAVWMQYPNISFGYKLKRMSFTLKGEAVSILNAYTTSGENEVTKSKNIFNGVTVAFYVEQRLWKNNVFVFGIKDSYEKFYWPTWMLFTTFNRYYHIPELSFCWIL
jgi:hypothetical protein